jgi:hypothetical protein
VGTSVGQGTVAGASQATLDKGQAQTQAQVSEANGEDKGRQRKTQRRMPPRRQTATNARDRARDRDRAIVHRYGLGASRLFTLARLCHACYPRNELLEEAWAAATLHHGWIAPPLLRERAVHAANLTSINCCGPRSRHRCLCIYPLDSAAAC